MRLEGAVCLVTGASSGIGRAAAVALSARGARVVALGRDEEALSGVGERTIVCDLADGAALARAAREAGAVDVLVNNAGIGHAGPFADTDPATAERLVAVNLLAPMLLTRALLPGMLERGRGHVVNVGSIVGHVGARDEAVYAATKGGLAILTESLRQELAGTAVHVTLVSPGVVDTAFFVRRGRPYQRRRPRPIPAAAVGEAIARAVERDAADVFIPRWLSGPARLRGALPRLYRALAARFG